MNLTTGLAIFGIVVTLLGVWYAKSQRDFAQKSFQLQSSASNPGSGLIEVPRSDLPTTLPNFLPLPIPYLPVGTDSKDLAECLDQRRILLVGRSGIGKTRAAIELVDLIETKTGELPTIILVQRLPFEAAKFIASSSPTRCVVLLLDDLHLMARRFDSVVHREGRSESFDMMFANLLEELEFIAPGKFWAIATLRTEPELENVVNLGKRPWTTFFTVRLRPLKQAQIKDVIRLVAQRLGLQVTPKAVDSMSNRSDGTVMSVLTYLNKERARGTSIISDQLADGFVGTYPLSWRADYDPFIKSNHAYISIFKSLGICRLLGVTPWIPFVVGLAATFYRFSIGREYFISRAIHKLGAWITIEQLRYDSYIYDSENRRKTVFVLRCPDVFLESVDLTDPSLRQNVARILVKYSFDRKGGPLLACRQIEEEMNSAKTTLSLEVGAVLITLFGKTRPYALKAISYASDLALVRERRAAPIIVRACADLNLMSRLSKNPEYLSRQADLAIWASSLGNPIVLGTILDIFEALPGSITRGDVAQCIPYFQDVDSLQSIISRAKTWSEDDRNFVAHITLSPFMYFTEVKTSDEVQEEAHMMKMQREPLSERIVIAFSDDCIRVRFRAIFASALSCNEAKHYLRALNDSSPAIRGAALLLLSSLGHPPAASNPEVISRIEVLQTDCALYGDVPLATLAAECKAVGV